MEITLEDGHLLTAGDLKLYRAAYTLYKVEAAADPRKSIYIPIGTWQPQNDIDTLTFHYEGHQIHFPPIVDPADEEEEALWDS